MNQDTVQLAAVPGGTSPPARDTGERPGIAPGDLQHAEAGLAVLLEAWQRAIEELGTMLPPAQVRALLAIDGADDLNVTGLGRVLGASPAATSRLCDRLVAAGLLARVPAASRREILAAAHRVRPAAGHRGSGTSGGPRWTGRWKRSAPRGGQTWPGG